MYGNTEPLHLAEQQGVSGEILLEAFIAGVEVEYAVAELCTNHIYFKGWWTSSVYGTFGAAVAGAKILGLDNIHIANAISMATCFTSGMKVSFGTDAKPLGIGMAASKGLQCALLSASGLTAPIGVFEDERGFFTLLNDNKQTLDTDLKLSEKWRLTDPGILFKSYPVCSAAQAGMEMTGILMQRHHLTSDDIESVICEVPPLVKMSLIYDQPASIRQAQFSMPFSVGCMLAYGKLGLKQLADDVLYDPRLQKQMQKVVMEVPKYMADDPTVMERLPEGASITLLTHNQGSVKDFLGKPTGMPGNPVTTEDLVVKFVACVTYGGLSAESATLIADQLLELETISNIRELHTWFA